MKHSKSELVGTIQLRNPIVFFHILPSGLIIAQDNIRANVGLLMLDLHHTSFYTIGDFKHSRKKFRAEPSIHIMTCLEKLIELQDGRIFCFGANNPIATMFAIRPVENGNPANCGIPWTRELAFGDYPYLRWQKKEWDDAHEAMANYEITYYPTEFDFEAKIIDIAEWAPYVLCVIYGDIMGTPTYMLAVIDPGTADNPKLSVLRCENLGSDRVAIGEHIAKWKNNTLYRLC